MLWTAVGCHTNAHTQVPPSPRLLQSQLLKQLLLLQYSCQHSTRQLSPPGCDAELPQSRGRAYSKLPVLPQLTQLCRRRLLPPPLLPRGSVTSLMSMTIQSSLR